MLTAQNSFCVPRSISVTEANGGGLCGYAWRVGPGHATVNDSFAQTEREIHHAVLWAGRRRCIEVVGTTDTGQVRIKASQRRGVRRSPAQ